jgi:uncharacterized protein YecE (DUF72 family)
MSWLELPELPAHLFGPVLHVSFDTRSGLESTAVRSCVRMLVGTSGWHYRDWRGAFYPANEPTKNWLVRYAEHFPSVELNNAFYRLPTTETFAGWAKQTPSQFLFSVKASRYLTHIRRLRDPEDPVTLLLERAAPLGPKLGPILLQLPPTLVADQALLARALRAFPGGVRVAVEFRHPSWFAPGIRTVLEQADASLCLSDREGPISPLWRTTSWGYLRLHAGRANPRPCYGSDALARWADRLLELFPATEDTFVYFNNDTNACAPRNARTLADLVATRGGSVIRPQPPG